MVTVRKHYRRVKRKNNKISKKKRRVFTSLAKQSYETGGVLDFEKGDLENAKVHFGSSDEVDFPWDRDYEVSYHTHPGGRDVSALPSLEDIMEMKQVKGREMIIFHNKKIGLSVYEEKKFRNVSKDKIKKFYSKFYRDINRMSDRAAYRKYKPLFRRHLGLDLQWHPADKAMKLRTRSI